jgi:sugar lactone lactonase YvrE
MIPTTLDAPQCALGEGAFWHPVRQEFFWCDILGNRLYSVTGKQWNFAENISAFGWIDAAQVMIATETSLSVLHLDQGTLTTVCALEPDNTVTRSNDGRADPQGGFWIGTMGKNAEKDAGAIYRYYRGELRQIVAPLTIPNAICFAPDGQTAYFADTEVVTIWAQSLDADGWPIGPRRVFLQTSGFAPDGAVVAADGTLWNAQWGAGRVAAYDPAGHFIRAVGFDAYQTSCPAFGGPDLTTLYVTSARVGLARPTDSDGRTFALEGVARGLPEYQVIL